MRTSGEPIRDGAAGVRIGLLGGFSLSVDGQPVPADAWRLRKARTLVKMLALAPGRRLHREQVVAELWPDRPPSAAANNLHQVLHAARRQLGSERVRLDDDVVLLAAVELDTEAFRAAALGALRDGDGDRADAALRGYGGPLLPEDLYEDWTEPARGDLERLREELGALAAGPARAARRDNLPPELTAFIGRDAALAELARLLRRGPLLTLSGPAGAGKTRLALEVAARQRDRLAGGVWLVELGPVTGADRVEDAVAAALGIRPAGGALVAALADRETLLVLDGCEHLVDAVAALATLLMRNCPDVELVATSREPLQVEGETVWRVPPLTLPAPGDADVRGSEAVRLFADRAAAVRPGFALGAVNAAAVGDICRRLDGIPLAIELAAARVESLAPEEIARRLEASFGLLRTRRQALDTALEWSHRLLDAGDAALLRRLSVFHGGFGLDAVEAVCDGDAEGVSRLVSKSLAVAEDGRYRLLEMVRRFAGERLQAAGEDDALGERHARWYLSLPDRPEGTPERLDAEAADLRAALARLLERDPPAALHLAGALSDWWLLRGRLSEGLEWLAAAVERTPRTPRAAAALLRAVPFAGRAGDLGRSRRLAEAALAISRSAGDRAGSARALHALGLLAWLRGDHAAARATLEESAAEAAGSPGDEANAAHALAVLATCSGDLDEAAAQLERTRERLDAPGHGDEPVFLVITPGLVPLLAPDGRVERAVQEESQIAFRRAVGPREAHAYVLLNAAVVARLRGDGAEADARLGDALARLTAAGDEPGLAQALAATGRLATVLGETERAHAALRDSLVLRRRLGDVRSVGLTLALLAELAAATGDPDHARSLLLRALTTFEQVGDRPARLWMLLALSRVELDARDATAARTHLDAARAVSEQLGARVLHGWTLALLGEADRLAGADARARRVLADALAAFERAGDPWGAARCRALLAR